MILHVARIPAGRRYTANSQHVVFPWLWTDMNE
jgi:hypothetical protein